jgi:chloramphenicol-sensitive protein RarD
LSSYFHGKVIVMNRGIISAIGAYLIWGIMPIWLKQIKSVPPLQILGHRIVWSLLLLLIVILIRGDWQELRQSLRNKRTLGIYTLAALLLSANWLTYIWAVNSDHIVESSLGYFINPLVNVILGVLLFREKLRKWQWAPIVMAGMGVIYLTFDYGRLPWIALTLAFTFAFYAVVKKVAPLGSLRGLTIETMILFLPAAIYLGTLEATGSGYFGHHGFLQDGYLAFAGVITAVPLLLFGSAARSIPLSMVGILQYIAPTCQFLIGVFVYDEPFTLARLTGFVIIWLALVFLWLEGFINNRRLQASLASIS